VCNLLGALGCKFIGPIDELRLTPTFLNETAQVMAAIAPALVAGHAQQIELDEDDCAGAGHWPQGAR
jgi:hypothetical protein